MVEARDPPEPGASLADWLDWQQRLHIRPMELGLDRVGAVWRRMGFRRPAPLVLTVGGTNGKGSCVAMLEAMLIAAGHAVGSYTSPHLRRYNERVRIRGREASDAELIAGFEAVEAARGDTTLTWFEYGTLAAFEVFAEAELDVVVLEVGLGGRLDAVNLVDADAAVVTTVALDHTDWLGPDRDSIGREKAGIFRSGAPAIVGDEDPPAGLLDAVRHAGALLLRADHDFGLMTQGDATHWWCNVPGAAGRYGNQIGTMLADRGDGPPGRLVAASAALAALHALREQLGWPIDAYVRACQNVRLRGRVERIANAPEVIVDVAHNPQAAAALAEWLTQRVPVPTTFAVFGALSDKDIAGIVAPFRELVAGWFLCDLPDAGPRSLAAAKLAEHVRASCPDADCQVFPNPPAALAAARNAAAPADRIVAFGSFHVAGDVLPESPVPSRGPV